MDRIEPLRWRWEPPPHIETGERSLALPRGWRAVLACAALAAILAGGLWLAQRRIDFDIDEEGFLWYGAVATAHGAVPLRDYRSYDPGRYLWSAAWDRALGDDLLTLRLAEAAFQAIGLLCGLLAARRAVRNPWLLALVGLLLAVWMYPRNKLFDSALALAGVYAAVLLAERPSLRRHAGAGALVGLAALFGKNHALYLSLAFLLLIVFLAVRGAAEGAPGLGRRLLAWAGGIAAGSLPLVAMLAIPGFLGSYLDSIRFFFAQGRTNTPLPVPWPWRVLGTGLGGKELLLQVGLGACFLLVLGFLAAAAVVLLRSRGAAVGERALLAASFFVGLFYAHHAFSRADLVHVGSCIQPVLLGVVALPPLLPGRRRIAAAAAAILVLALLTGAAMVPAMPLYEKLVDGRRPHRITGEELWLEPREDAFLRWVERRVDAAVPPGEPILMSPNLDGLYPLLGRRSPVWDIYPLWPAQGEADRAMLRELVEHRVRWALIHTRAATDGRPDLRFPSTHPEVWAYLEREFHPVARRGACVLLERGEAAPPPRKRSAPRDSTRSGILPSREAREPKTPARCLPVGARAEESDSSRCRRPIRLQLGA
jgi:hypothetical protein